MSHSTASNASTTSIARSALAPPSAPSVGVSRYATLAARLRERIVSGDWLPGTPLPSEQSLATAHQVALGTLRQALDVLAEEGLIERVHGRGTFVKQGLAGAPMLRFFRFGGELGRTPESRVLGREVLEAPPHVAREFGVAARSRVIKLKRLRLFDGVPCLYEELWLRLPLFAALARAETSTFGDLLYPFFARTCKVHIHRVTDTVSFEPLPAAAARALARPTGHPGAVIRRSAFDLSGVCVEVRISRADAQAFHYTATIS